MGRFFIRTISTSLAVLLAAYLLKGVEISSALTAIVVAVLLGLLNSFVKPILVFLTIPITILTLGFFLLVINVIIILLVDDMVAGFSVNTWLTALFFSFIVSFTASLIEKLIGVPGEKEEE
jgi:putative membrane protein